MVTADVKPWKRCLSPGAFSLNHEDRPMGILTDAERCFVDHRYHETLDSKTGPATQWLVEHGILPSTVLPLFHARSRELKETGTGPTKPDEFVIPWTGKAEFLTRVEVIEAELRSD